MRIRWSVILPFIGLILFTAVTIRSAKLNDHDESHRHKYFWWSSLRLDTDPLNEHPVTNVPCPNGKGNCAGWYQLPNRWIEPSLLDKAFVVSAIPAFLAGAALVIGLSKLGVDEVLTFFVSMPILLFGWYYLVGWLIERWLDRRARSKNIPLKLS